MTLVNRDFLRDFAELANRFGWDGRELEEVKEQSRQSQELRDYWQKMAYAYRNGYAPQRANNWERLDCFFQRLEEEERVATPYGRRETDRPPPYRSRK